MPIGIKRAFFAMAAVLVPVLVFWACAYGDGSTDAASEGDVPDVDAPDGEDTGPSCRPEETLCGDECVNLNTNHENCGSCGHECPAAEVCYMGECSLECPAGFDDCGGGCVDVRSDPDNCGGCGIACHDTQVCVGEECVCSGSLTDCSGVCVQLATDVNNCGSCGNVCDPDPPHASPECVAGICGILCDAGWSDNNGMASDGCESTCEITSPTELCNGLDDNCDGNIDEGFDCREGRVESCTTTCSSTGTRTCSDACFWGACEPPAETCNGADDDCVGGADNGFECVRGSSESCTTSCSSTGSRTCSSTCTWSACDPPDEVCDAVDHDCDGLAYNVSLPFSDVPDSNPCFPYVWAVNTAGVMTGASSTQFQPGTDITRAQIALAIQRALGINPNGTYQASDICDLYDVSTESGTAILALFDHHITMGKTGDCLVGSTCTTTTYHYCPLDYVTRNELGVFLWRADDPGSTMDCPTCPSSRYFCDTGGMTGCGCIEALGSDLPSKSSCEVGSTCSPTAYCPSDNVTRCEAATALANVFSLSLPPVCM